MGRRGPAPTPTKTLEKRGSWRANSREDEPRPAMAKEEAYEAPSTLNDASAAIWNALAPRLKNAGLLTSADLPTFERYCRSYAVWREVMERAEDDPSRKNVLSLAKLDDIVRKLEARFGLSPTDRVGLEVTEEKDENAKDRFFKKAG